MCETDVHRFEVKSFNPRAGVDCIKILPRNYIYSCYIWNLKRPYINQIFLDLCKKIYDTDMLSRIIESGQLDSFGCSSVEGMKKMRFCNDDHGFKILN
jgi:hypothetical protein